MQTNVVPLNFFSIVAPMSGLLTYSVNILSKYVLRARDFTVSWS